MVRFTALHEGCGEGGGGGGGGSSCSGGGDAGDAGICVHDSRFGRSAAIINVIAPYERAPPPPQQAIVLYGMVRYGMMPLAAVLTVLLVDGAFVH